MPGAVEPADAEKQGPRGQVGSLPHATSPALGSGRFSHAPPQPSPCPQSSSSHLFFLSLSFIQVNVPAQKDELHPEDVIPASHSVELAEMFPSDVVSTLGEGAVIALGDITPAVPPPAGEEATRPLALLVPGARDPFHGGVNVPAQNDELHPEDVIPAPAPWSLPRCFPRMLYPRWTKVLSSRSATSPLLLLHQQPPPPTKKLRCFQSQSQLQAKPSSQGAPSKAGKPDRACAPLPAPSLHVRTADRWPTVLSVRVQGPRARNIDVSLSPVLRSRPPSVGVGRVFTTFPERGRHPEVPATLAPVLCEDCVPTWERSAEARAAREPWDAKSLARRNTHEDTLWLAELRANRGCSSGASEGC
ncbi:hypothetical protein P7K49_029673 [Saguinus oedipus]|uniref:Uncharacterized protein n=1 Tax=Saguinus oedipus TaxID=9490 RepID=A0ABQ9U8N2_SAGOE|nr:hypothetical protein P7K49_029673 [Saguinus oedipus]